MKRDMRGAEALRLERCRSLTRRALVLEQLQGSLAKQQAHLSQSRSGHSDALFELLALEPQTRLVGELESEDIVVEANRRVEVLHGDTDVMQTFHGSSLVSRNSRRSSHSSSPTFG